MHIHMDVCLCMGHACVQTRVHMRHATVHVCAYRCMYMDTCACAYGLMCSWPYACMCGGQCVFLQAGSRKGLPCPLPHNQGLTHCAYMHGERSRGSPPPTSIQHSWPLASVKLSAMSVFWRSVQLFVNAIFD